ncbi:uncharacterized protein LOC113503738 [Trichoplusia ni]|uniref:Uncharacterized protein LOC113503738 n=1 Tax=Trichoplusia ni TaxID=7111 RepID=A0A7E5WMN9_TRINI|nr:uncharacterized protein LOC113503738 [Trichoplusia ni]
MDRLRVRVNFKYISSVFLLVLGASQLTAAWELEYALDGSHARSLGLDVVTLAEGRSRARRDVVTPPPALLGLTFVNATAVPGFAATTPMPSNVTSNDTPGSNKTAAVTERKSSLFTLQIINAKYVHVFVYVYIDFFPKRMGF